MATTHPVTGTISSKPAELSRFLARSLHDCHTRTRHTVLGQSCSSPWNESEAWGTDRHTKVRHKRGFGVAIRGQIYQFRIRVPKDVRDVIGKTHLSRSLRTDSLTVANRLAARCAIEATAIFEEARSSSALNTQSVVLNGFQGVTAISFDELCRGYLDDPTSSRTEKSLHAYRSSLSVLVEIIGVTKLARDIDRATCRDAMQVLRALPSNARKRWPNESLRDIAARSVKDGLQTMSAANVNEYMNKLSTVLNWGVREEHCSANPAKGLRLPKVTSAKSRRDAFLLDDAMRFPDTLRPADVERAQAHAASLTDVSQFEADEFDLTRNWVFQWNFSPLGPCLPRLGFRSILSGTDGRSFRWPSRFRCFGRFGCGDLLGPFRCRFSLPFRRPFDADISIFRHARFPEVG